MKLTLTLTHRTPRKTTHLLEYNGRLHEVTMSRKAKERGLDNNRRAIRKTLGIRNNEFRFIGNRLINGCWVTEWMIL